MRRRSPVILLAAALAVSTVPVAAASASSTADHSSAGQDRVVTGELWIAEGQTRTGSEITAMAVRDSSGTFVALDAESGLRVLRDAQVGDTVSVTLRSGPEAAASTVISGDVLAPAQDDEQDGQQAAAEDEAQTELSTSGPGVAGGLLDVQRAATSGGATAGVPHRTFVTYIDDAAVGGDYSEASARQVLQLGTDYWKRETRGVLSGWNVAAAKKWTRTSTCSVLSDSNPNTLYAVWGAAAAQYPSANFTWKPGGDTLVVFVPADCFSAAGWPGWTGMTTIGTGLRSGGFSFIVVGDEGTMAHELGHELGLGHSNVELGSTLSSHILEYGGIHSVMGIDVNGYSAPALDAALQYGLGVIPASQATTITKPGTSTVTLSPVSASSGVRTAMFRSVGADGAPVIYAVEYRDGKGVDATAAYAVPAAAAFPLWDPASTTVSYAPGVRVYRLEAGELAQKGLGSTTMTNPPAGGKPRTATFTSGTSYKDPAGNFTVSVGAVGATAAVTITTRAFAVLNALAKSTTTYGKKRSFVGTFSNAAATGTVTVAEGSKVLGRASVSAGRVTVPLPKNLKAGEHTLWVSYSGTPGATGFLPERGPVTLVVKKAKAKAKITATKSRLKRGRTAKVTVQLKKVLKAKPTGKVLVKVGKKTVSKKAKVVKKVKVTKKKHGKKKHAKAKKKVTFVAKVTTKKLTKKGKVRVVFTPKNKNLAKKTYSTKYKVR